MVYLLSWTDIIIVIITIILRRFPLSLVHYYCERSMIFLAVFSMRTNFVQFFWPLPFTYVITRAKILFLLFIFITLCLVSKKYD